MLNFRIDKLSFWIGFAAASIIWWLLLNARPALKTLRQILTERVGTLREGITTSVEVRYRQDVIRIYQDNHIASPLFSLDEVAIEPRLLPPPPPVIPGGEIPLEDITQIAIPFLPGRPDFAAAFGVKTLSFRQAMSKGANLLLVAPPGGGKTFALSLVAVRVAQRHAWAGELGNLVPVLLHAAELSLPGKQDDPLNVLYKALYDKVSTLVEAQLPTFLNAIFEGKLALLMIDGLDELPTEAQRPVVQFIHSLQGKYPGNRYLIAASPQDISCQQPLKLHTIPLAAWSGEQRRLFLRRWGKLWRKHIPGQSWSKPLPGKIDPLFLNNLLLAITNSGSPLINTLQVWALYAGDVLGPGDHQALEAYIRRMTTGVGNARPAMEQLAMQMLLARTPILARKTAGSYISAFEEAKPANSTPAAPAAQGGSAPDSLFDNGDFEDLLQGLGELDGHPEAPGAPLIDERPGAVDQPDHEPDKQTVKTSKMQRMLPELVKADILVYRPDTKIGFAHPVIAGFLAGGGFASLGSADQLLDQPDWPAKTLAGDFFVAAGDAGSLASALIASSQNEPLKQSLAVMSNWPRLAPKHAPWRGQIMRTIAGVIQQPHLPITLRANLLAALAFSGEENIGSLFHQFAKSPEHSVRWLGALGCGLIRDEKAAPDLGGLLYDPSIFVSRAACLSLVAVNSTQSIGLLATALHEANEEVRRSVAEALAYHPGKGHSILQDGSKVEDQLVRRAVIYGFAHMPQAWAVDTLNEMQILDKEWFIRNAAAQALEENKQLNPSIPADPFDQLHLTPWLIAFASERTLGLAPGQAAWDMLATALDQGTEDQRLAALDIYRFKPIQGSRVVPSLIEIIGAHDGEIREAAYHTLWHLNAAGVNLPQ